jgi:uncharacterized protein (DUF362 family)
MRRRDLLRAAAGLGTGAIAAALAGCRQGPGAAGWRCRARPHPAAREWLKRIGLARGGAGPGRNVRAAIERLCGPEAARTFVRAGDTVVVKPNIGWPQPPEMGANVDPAVVAAVVRLCGEAGAARVKVFDNSVGTDSRCYEFSGIEQAARQAGAEVFLCAPHRFRTVEFDDPAVKRLARWPLYEDALAADVLINIAVAKTHNLSLVTLCMKNLMGLQGGDRGKMHQEIHQNLADLNVMVRPTLNILDATRVMVKSGPSGGRKDYCVRADTIVCGTSSVTVDAWAADPANLPWPAGHHEAAAVACIALGAAAGLGASTAAQVEVAA